MKPHKFVVNRADLPGRWKEELDAFQKLLVIKALRPDKLTNAFQEYVSENLGQRFIEPQVCGLYY